MPLLATSNSLINCRNGIIKLSFGNMTLDLNIFNNSKEPGEDEEIEEVNCINIIVDEHVQISSFSDLHEPYTVNSYKRVNWKQLSYLTSLSS